MRRLRNSWQQNTTTGIPPSSREKPSGAGVDGGGFLDPNVPEVDKLVGW